ncbi:hypothetical protein [Ruminococcus sp. HUN007]|uniref:hypothetical protein n=1 Tax=Ruminococcus sp. HUN007 TaxID=1514668 RepID=UPI0005D1B365|nr:hypothetical protein [Ruminococcus sp. HUN007]
MFARKEYPLCLSKSRICCGLPTVYRNDLEKAYYIAHKLKGGVNNLELKPIAVPLCELTDLLRNKQPGDYKELYDEIISRTNDLLAL